MKALTTNRTGTHGELCNSLANTDGEKHSGAHLHGRPVGATEPDATRQDVEAAVNVGMTTHVSIYDKELFVREVINKNLEEKYVDETNESDEKCHGPENHDEFAWEWSQDGFERHEEPR